MSDIPRSYGDPVKDFAGVFNVDTDVLTLTWNKYDYVTLIQKYVIIYREGSRADLVPPFGSTASWEEYYDMELLAEVDGNLNSFDYTDLDDSKEYLFAIYPVYGNPVYNSILVPSARGMITLLELDTFTGGSLEDGLALPRGLNVDSVGNLYFNNSYLRDTVESPQYFVTSVVTLQNDIVGIEAPLDNFTTSTTDRFLCSLYNEKVNSTFYQVGGGNGSYIQQYKIDDEEYVEFSSTGNTSNNNQRLMYINNLIASDNETGFIYFTNDEQGTNPWRGIWELRPELSISGFMSGQGGTTTTLNATDVKFNNTIYQDDIILGQLLHTFISYFPTTPRTSGAGVVINKDATSFTVRFDGSAQTSLQYYKRSNFVAVNVNSGGASSTNFYEISKPNGFSYEQGWIHNNELYVAYISTVVKINLTTKERTTIGNTITDPKAVAVDSEDNVYVATSSAVYKLDDGTFVLMAGGATVDSTPNDGEGEDASFAGIKGMVYSAVDDCLYVSDYSSIANHNIRKVSLTGVVSDKPALGDNEDETDNTNANSNVDSEGDDDQTIGNNDYTLDIPEGDNPVLEFSNPEGGLIQLIPITGREPGDVFTLRKNNNVFEILHQGKIVYTYLLTPVEIKLLPSDGYIGWYQYGTTTPISTPEGKVYDIPVEGYKYILKTTIVERMHSTQSPFMYGNRQQGYGFLLFEDDTYVYDRALLDDDINRALYVIHGGRKYYYNDVDYLESPVLPANIVNIIAATPLRENLIEVDI